MKISSCSRALVWPTYSSSSFGRSARSMASSFGEPGAALTTRRTRASSAGFGPKSSVLIAMADYDERVDCAASLRAMLLRTSRLPLWLALVAMLALAVLPTLSHALAFARGGAAWAEVCTPQGMRLVAVDAAQSAE